MRKSAAMTDLYDRAIKNRAQRLKENIAAAEEATLTGNGVAAAVTPDAQLLEQMATSGSNLESDEMLTEQLHGEVSSKDAQDLTAQSGTTTNMPQELAFTTET
jgi:hypothetical protein